MNELLRVASHLLVTYKSQFDIEKIESCIHRSNIIKTPMLVDPGPYECYINPNIWICSERIFAYF